MGGSLVSGLPRPLSEDHLQAPFRSWTFLKRIDCPCLSKVGKVSLTAD